MNNSRGTHVRRWMCTKRARWTVIRLQTEGLLPLLPPPAPYVRTSCPICIAARRARCMWSEYHDNLHRINASDERRVGGGGERHSWEQFRENGREFRTNYSRVLILKSNREGSDLKPPFPRVLQRVLMGYPERDRINHSGGALFVLRRMVLREDLPRANLWINFTRARAHLWPWFTNKIVTAAAVINFSHKLMKREYVGNVKSRERVTAWAQNRFVVFSPARETVFIYKRDVCALARRARGLPWKMMSSWKKFRPKKYGRRVKRL